MIFFFMKHFVMVIYKDNILAKKYDRPEMHFLDFFKKNLHLHCNFQGFSGDSACVSPEKP